MGDWIEWKGGECPVPGDALVCVRLRCGDEDKMEAINFDWFHRSDDSPEYDIIAYRLSTPTAQAAGEGVAPPSSDMEN